MAVASYCLRSATAVIPTTAITTVDVYTCRAKVRVRPVCVD